MTENTFEEKINAMIQGKKELAELTVASGEQWLSELSNDDIRQLVQCSLKADHFPATQFK